MSQRSKTQPGSHLPPLLSFCSFLPCFPSDGVLFWPGREFPLIELLLRKMLHDKLGVVLSCAVLAAVAVALAGAVAVAAATRMVAGW